jgi:hypothetical protein
MTLIIEQLGLLKQACHKYMYKLLAVLSVLFAPISGIMITVGLAILADTVIGLWKATKLKQKISSRRLSRLITKILVYESAIILFYLIDKYMLGDILAHFFTIDWLLTKVVGLVLASVEVFSIDENYKAVKGFGIFDAFKKLVAKAKDVKEDIDQISNN